MSEKITIAGVQMDVDFCRPDDNVTRICKALETAASHGAHLTIFPECAVTGYCFDSLDEARPFAESIPGPSCERIAAVCRQRNCFAVCGLLEVDGERIFNACALLGPDGLIASYRKIHLPFLGIDRFTTPGDRPFQVTDAGGLRVGMNICYDSAFPESARVMALQGADLVVLPTNFPTGAECMAEHVVQTRAMENKIYYACVNRIGTERGFDFIGVSKICDPNGRILAKADMDETILYAEIDPQEARVKRVIRVPDKHEIERFKDRRPEMYGLVAESQEENA
jgi:predicted amidohydrolase